MDLFSSPPPVPSVTELTARIKKMLETGFPDVLVQGEVSQPKLSGNGHLYFTLKDETAQLPCVVWRSAGEKIISQIEHGARITAGGGLQVYPPSGRYQLIVNYVERAGLGTLQARFEALKAKLQGEGLFDAARKRKLPVFPKRIGVVTSESGAAFQDIRTTLERRWPLVHVVLYHASVQGAASVAEIERGIRHFSESRSVDVVIVGRGGGSLEDLWSFNEEAVARAVAACQVPVISAVGHETDFTICDFVADVRAATPTQAAVLAVPDRNDVQLYLDEQAGALARVMQRKLEMSRLKVESMGTARLKRLLPMRLDQTSALLEHAAHRMATAVRQRLDRSTGLVREMQLSLAAHDPSAPMRKGYARASLNGTIIRSRDEAAAAGTFSVEWMDGALTVEKKNQPPAS